MFALSTSWNFNPRKSGKQVVDEIKKIGFDRIELNFSFTQKNVEQILKVGGITIVSLHNYCPIPNGLSTKEALPDCYSLSSPVDLERKKAVEFTKRTIIYASKFKAKAVVLHTGRVEVTDHTKRLIKLINSGNGKKCEFYSLRDLAIKEREDNKDRFLESVFFSLRELSSFAYDQGVALGVENRIYIREIPNFKEIKIFLENFSKKGVYYWHDTGHAYILEKLGFPKHIDYISSYANHLLGIHLHDVKDFTDHKAPFTGEIDFSKFKPYLKNNTIKVIEAHKPATAEEIIYSKKRLEKLFSQD